MMGAHLLLLAGLISIAATRYLPAARWVYQAPGRGLAAWYAALASIVVSGAAAVASTVLRWPVTQRTVCAWWALCVDAVSGNLGPLGRLASWVMVAAVIVGVATATRRIVGAVAETGRAVREHRRILSMIGRPDARLGAIVVDDERLAAYALPGRRQGIVITSGALDTLPASQVQAILAHERAHAQAHHHLLLTGARLLHQAFPALQVFAGAYRQIDRLVELHADDIATRAHLPLDLARALVSCAEAAARPSGVPVPVLAAAAHGGDAVERVHRLLTPPAALTAGQRLAVSAGLTAVVVAPIAVALFGLVFPGLGACLPIAVGG